MSDNSAIAEIPNLWPEFDIDVITPAAILRTQAAQLQQMTKGLLYGEVMVTEGENEIRLALDAVAPALENYRYRILSAKHGRGFIYPVEVDSAFGKPVSYEVQRSVIDIISRTPYNADSTNAERFLSQREFIERIRKILTDHRTVGVIQSLIARINEEKATTKSAG